VVNSKFKELLDKRRSEYKAYPPMFCQVLRDYVIFNSDGFMHLRFHIDGTPRKPEEQMYKLGLLPLVRPTIHLSPRAEYEKRLAPIGRKKNNGQKILKEVQYWALEAIVGKQNVKLKVVLRKIGTGKLHFWSVMKLGENIKTP